MNISDIKFLKEYATYTCKMHSVIADTLFEAYENSKTEDGDITEKSSYYFVKLYSNLFMQYEALLALLYSFSMWDVPHVGITGTLATYHDHDLKDFKNKLLDAEDPLTVLHFPKITDINSLLNGDMTHDIDTKKMYTNYQGKIQCILELLNDPIANHIYNKSKHGLVFVRSGANIKINDNPLNTGFTGVSFLVNRDENNKKLYKENEQPYVNIKTMPFCDDKSGKSDALKFRDLTHNICILTSDLAQEVALFLKFNKML